MLAQTELNQFYRNHLLESETYVGGHVEALEAGVFRSDIPLRFRIVPEAVQKLIDGLDEALIYAITGEEKKDLSCVTNFAEQRDLVRTSKLWLTDIETEPCVFTADQSQA